MDESEIRDLLGSLSLIADELLARAVDDRVIHQGTEDLKGAC